MITFTTKQTFNKSLLTGIPSATWIRYLELWCLQFRVSVIQKLNGTLSFSFSWLPGPGRACSLRENFFFPKKNVTLDSLSFKISIWTGTKNTSFDLYLVYLLGEKLKMGSLFRRWRSIGRSKVRGENIIKSRSLSLIGSVCLGINGR